MVTQTSNNCPVAASAAAIRTARIAVLNNTLHLDIEPC